MNRKILLAYLPLVGYQLMPIKYHMIYSKINTLIVYQEYFLKESHCIRMRFFKWIEHLNDHMSIIH